MVQNLWVLVEEVFRRGLEREFVIVDWNFLVVDHLRKLSRDVVLVVDELTLEAMRYGDQGWDKRRLFAGVEMISVVQGKQCVRERDVFRFIDFGIHESEVFEKTSKQHSVG
nr:hypothetical protein [Tanacetum cinerariifolium]